MKILLAALAFAVVAGAAAPALAQTKAPVYRYCLQENPLGRGVGGTLCRFNTLAQCWASKTSPSDLCYLNPAYVRR